MRNEIDINHREQDDDHHHLDAKVFNFQLCESPVARPPLEQHCHLTIIRYKNIKLCEYIQYRLIQYHVIYRVFF